MSRIKSLLLMSSMQLLGDMGCVLSRDRLEMNSEELLRKTMVEFSETNVSENAIKGMFQNHLSRDDVQNFANVIQELSNEIIEEIGDSEIV